LTQPKFPPTGIRNILVIKPSSLGDIIDALPAVGAIRRHFREAHIAWLVKSEWAPILIGHPFIDEVIAVPFQWRGLPQILQAIRRRRPFDLVIDLQGLFRSAALGYLTGAARRIGLAEAREGAPWFYTDTVAIPKSVTHAVERSLRVAAALGADPQPVAFGLSRTEAAAAEADRFMETAGFSAPFVLLHPAARWERKRWPPERFAQVGDWLLQNGTVPVFTGGSGDHNALQQICLIMNRRGGINGAGRLTLTGLAELQRRALYFIGNDSGPMHLAAAVGTKVVALFGPTDPNRVGPYGTGHRVIQKRNDCIGCHRGACVHQNRCMKAIQVEDVQTAIETAWHHEGGPSHGP
jgi:lipopolysaccharide heptosyltransferase I